MAREAQRPLPILPRSGEFLQDAAGKDARRTARKAQP